ncbi:hypothetical protein RQM47_03560 [Rubrivirga sp. S365]|uniref:ABC-2 type transport system permease protein n=1 Tax=Rubrivirga litoralis TaxID=3075598 RepID=A0ABU3BLN0_9BACT|nr:MULTISPECIES: hypothetical protein [unclassified Rubrivirga]MDT0630199.1 hypothetical protein [Rubrivirga sp. F394]MDT7855710.1 hypothetical protein [Rubrivirga sp. S365]
MSSVLPGSQSRPARWMRGGAGVAAALALGALASTTADGLDATGRGTLVRYLGILISGALAIGTPHLLYPDPAAGRLQLSNPWAGRLLRHQIERVAPILAVLSLPALAVSWGAGQWFLGVEGALAVWTVGLYALGRYASLGLRVQAWEQNGASGRRRVLTWATTGARSPEADAFTAPSLLTTAEVFLVGSVLAILGQALGAGWGIGGPVAALGLAGVVLLRRAETYDRSFWTTNGVWADAFQSTGTEEDGREALAYDAVYWAPPALRPAVWAGLLSLDRRLPLGRLALGGLALVAIVAFAGVPEGVFAGAVLLWIAAVNGAVAFTARPALIPSALAYRLHGGAGWAAARFLMNVRWLPLLIAVLALLAWLTDVEARSILMWSLVYLATAAVSSLAVTIVERFAFRRALA